VDEACGGVQRGAPFENAATLCRPLGSCVAPDVDHVEEIHFGGSIMPSDIIENLDRKKTSFRPSKWPRKLKPAKNSKLPKLPENCFEPVGKGGWPPISTWINPPSLGRNGAHCIEFLHEMRKLLLNLDPGEPIALVKELACFDNSI
jgi:hypothetical protein